VRPSLTFWILAAALGFLLYALAVPKIGGHGEARLAAAKADIRGGIKSALEQYRVDNGHYPHNLQNLVQKTDDATNWHGPYFDPPRIPIDPWGNTYIYRCPGKHNPDSYDLLSMGPDQKEGTGDDISNWVK